MGILNSAKPAFGTILILALCLAFQGVIFAQDEPDNMFLNPSFEEGTVNWLSSTDAGTVTKFTVDEEDAVHGKKSGLVNNETVSGWGSLLGQHLDGGENGKEYTYACFLRSADGGPVEVTLHVARWNAPFDRAALSPIYTLIDDKWEEYHVTFTVKDDFPGGWLVLVECKLKGQYRADMFRLYEGEYVPFDASAEPESVSPSASSLVTTWGNIRSESGDIPAQ